ncbi:prepilin peptidase dependent protein B [Erwinia sp. JUb26]|nr:prepilin peptidase dependent protein B [Erwinia sp. JUb26]
MNQAGFTLLETLLAMAIGSVMMLGAARTLPLLQQQNLRLQMQVQLNEEVQQIMQTLEKAVRRAGYCHGRCSGAAMQIQNGGRCLLVRWDENSNGQWENTGREDSDYYGFRLRAKNLEMQRGVDRCGGGGWEKLNDPRIIAIEEFRVVRNRQQVRVMLKASSSMLLSLVQHVEHWLVAENL